MTFNDYSSGARQAKVEESQMKAAPWQRGQQYYGRGIKLLNVAFEVYYNAKTGINACSDGKHKEEMTSQLEDCATEGWGFGVADLDDGFQHLVSNQGNWTDASKRFYSGKFQGLAGGMADIPACAYQFLTAVESKFKLLTEAFTDYDKQTGLILQGLDTSNWAQIEVALKSMKDNASKAKKVIWLAPATIKDAAGKAFTFVDLLADIDQAVRDVDKLKQAGLNDQAAISLQVVGFVTGKLPILGSFYSKIVGALPDFFLNMKEMFEKRREKILSYAHMH
jgi:hypothetical protein